MISNSNYKIVIQALILCLLIFFVISWLIPSYWNWSALNPNLSLPIGFIFAGFIAIVSFFPLSGRLLFEATEEFIDILRGLFSRLPSFARLTLWLAISGIILFLCRGHTYLYGDGHLIISNIEKGNLVSLTAFGFSLFIKFSARLFHINSWIGPANFMAWISIICGVVYLYFLYKILTLLIEEQRLRPLFYLIAATSAIIVLFTGYVETYSILTAWLALYLYYSLRFLKGEGKTYILILIFVMGVFWHVWFAAFFPSLLYVINKRHKILSGKIIVALSSLYILGMIVGGRIILREGIPPVIPILSDSDTNYSLVSYHHIIDIFNIMVMAGPVMIILGLALIIMNFGRKLSSNLNALIFAGIPSLTIAVFLDPALGAVRDWDVLSIFALPIILTGIVLLWKYIREAPKQAYILIPLLLIGILQTGTFIVYNKNTDLAVDRIIRVLRDDPHYSDAYYGGERILPFTTIISNVYERHKEGSEFLERRAQSSSSKSGDLVQLAYQYYNQKNYEKALDYLSELPAEYLDIDRRAKYCYATSLFHMNDFKKSSTVLSELAQDTSFSGLYFLLSGSMMYQGNDDSAYSAAIKGLRYAEDTVKYVSQVFDNVYFSANYDLALRFQKIAFAIKPEGENIALGLGMVYQALNQPDSARKYLQMTLQQDSTNINALLGMVYVQYSQKQYQDALERLDDLDMRNPQSADIKYWIARVLSKMGRNGEALDACAEALHLSPNHIPARIFAGSELYARGEYSQSAEQFSQVLLLDKRNVSAILWLARINDKLGNGTEAWRMLNRWKELKRKTAVDSETAALLKKYNFSE